MKKVLFLSLILALGFSGFAQRASFRNSNMPQQYIVTKIQDPKDEMAQELSFSKPSSSLVLNNRESSDFEEFATMITLYDKQNISAIGNRLATWSDGSAAVVATWSSDVAWSSRGTGYNYYDGNDFDDMPTNRAEEPKSGWPSICPSGNGEILVSHSGGANVYRRAVKGQGEWQFITNFEKMMWPRVCSSGNGQYVHLIGAELYSDSQGSHYHNWYARSTDGGLTWSEPVIVPLLDEEMYHNALGSDCYTMASNGNTIAILFGGITHELFYVISHDNGETWEKQIVAHTPYGHAHDWSLTDLDITTDTIWSADHTQSIAIDNHGTAHVVFALSAWSPVKDYGAGYYAYWPYIQSIVYWNSEYVNEQGGHDIPLFGDWSQDANWHNWTTKNPTLNGENGISSTLMDERLIALANADDNKHLHLFGWPDENGDGQCDYREFWSGHDDCAYVSYGISTSPAISIDQNGSMAIVYSCLSETRIFQDYYYYRSAYVTYRDSDGTWFDDYENISSDFLHMLDEVYPVWASSNAYNGSFWIAYSADQTPGIFIDGAPWQPEATENVIYAVKLTPSMEGWNVEEVVNPMTNVRIYPNPAQDVLNVEVNASQASDINITIFNITGQKVMEESTSISTGINVPSLNISGLTSGIYFATVKANGFENTMKFVVK